MGWFFDAIFHAADCVRRMVNGACANLEPWQIAAYTCAMTTIFFWLYLTFFRSRLTPQVRVRKAFFRLVRRLPWIQNKIAAESSKTRAALFEAVHKCDPEARFFVRLPENGLSEEEIVKIANKYENLGTYDYQHGRVSGTVYKADEKLISLFAQICRSYSLSNPLHPDVFPGCRKMEAEIVRMVGDLFHGDSESCGVVTSGGTESLLLACLAYRNRAYDKGIEYPEMVIPVTAHAAFDKAAELFGIRVRHVPVDPKTYKVDVGAMRSAISSNTCMLAGSTPNFPHGIVDPIEEIGELGQQYNIPVHVDACLGGFLVAFMDEAGFPLRKLDFRVPGVTSISCDTHKYGFATKGSSVLLYRHAELIHYQYFCQPDWPGGIYASPTMAGSRSGYNIAACWASLMYHGRSGYVDSTRRIIDTSRQIEKGLRAIEGITVLGQPEVSVVAFTSFIFNPYTLCDRLNKLGWHLNALQFPSAIHICVTMTQTTPGIVEKFLEDTKTVSAQLVENPKLGGEGTSAAIYGTAQRVPDRSIISEISHLFIDACYSTGKRPQDAAN